MCRAQNNDCASFDNFWVAYNRSEVHFVSLHVFNFSYALIRLFQWTDKLDRVSGDANRERLGSVNYGWDIRRNTQLRFGKPRQRAQNFPGADIQLITDEWTRIYRKCNLSVSLRFRPYAKIVYFRTLVYLQRATAKMMNLEGLMVSRLE